MTYADDPKAHIRTEFGFDVTQVAKNRYTSDRYHDFIGFEVSKPVLERAFQDTYGIPLSRRTCQRRSGHWNFPAGNQYHYSRDDAAWRWWRGKRTRRRNPELQFAENFATTFRGPIIKKNGAKDTGGPVSERECWRSS